MNTNQVKRLSVKGFAGRHGAWVFFLAATFTLLSANAAAQVRVSALMKGKTPLKSTGELRCIRYSDFNEIDVALKMSLEPGDELYSLDGAVTMEIRASADSRFTAYGRFRVIVMPANGKDIAVNLLTGEGHMQASAPTGLSSGETNMGSGHTEYSARIYRTEQGPVQELIVYEGDVRTNARELETSLATGQKLVLRPRAKVKPEIAKVNEKDIYHAAAIYAQVDTGKAIMSDEKVDPEEVYKRFMGRYTSVLGDPTNAKNRLSLAVEQVNLGVSSDAIYQLNKAEQFTPTTDTGSRAAIAVTKGAAFTQAGRPNDAALEFNKAKKINPGVFREENLGSYGLNEKTRKQIAFAANYPGISDLTNTPQSWPVPPKLSQEEAEEFKLISEKRFEDAFETMRAYAKQHPDHPLPTDSIGMYATAIIFYERKDFPNARSWAIEAINRSQEDHLLSEYAYAACKRIIQ